MKKFSRFQHQYILMMASDAYTKFEKMLKDQPGDALDPNIENYMQELLEIRDTAAHNMKIYDERAKD